MKLDKILVVEKLFISAIVFFFVTIVSNPEIYTGNACLEAALFVLEMIVTRRVIVVFNTVRMSFIYVFRNAL